MGQFHFDVPDAASDFIQRSLWNDAYICGIEGVPWQSRNEFDGSRLTITRGIESSGKLYIACPLEGMGYRSARLGPGHFLRTGDLGPATAMAVWDVNARAVSLAVFTAGPRFSSRSGSKGNASSVPSSRA